MNEKFLDKLFKIYSIISYHYAQKQNIEEFLISSYYKDKALIYPYEYIDFELMYRVAKDFTYTGKVYDKDIILHITKTQATDMALFLYEMEKKITDNLNGITEKDILKLNEYYKQIL